jgi:mRNA-degrading endonuclease RelE of RelBE toxin-antitoxin system
MKSVTTEKFRRAFRALPPDVRKQARSAYRRFRDDPFHNSLNFKRVSRRSPIYSARVNLDYRVLGIRDEDTIAWFWIGTHSDYDKLLKQM